ncbi:hypothetical protein GCM10007857_30660 [Bradyrhizobium iriomotense]|uniref:Uncharacterized protein n=1 Tax=Bradyrhizobium iriomotense TaxID=441950 RepID=A0ABQ6AY53_9BRAD|nr:hypothetical protein GCM10007857_30660 [Bradyrhizobium iriomotense]
MRLKAGAEPDFVFYRPFSSCLSTDLRYVENWRAAASQRYSENKKAATQLKGAECLRSATAAVNLLFLRRLQIFKETANEDDIFDGRHHGGDTDRAAGLALRGARARS